MQIFFNSAFSASIYSLVALSFSLVYAPARFFHIAHGVVYAAGAYAAFLGVGILHWGILPSLMLGVLVAGVLGAVMDVSLFGPLRRRRANPLVLLMASMGLYVVLQNLISMLFGDDVKSIRTWPVREGLEFLGARITPVQIIIIVAAILIFAGVILALKHTKMGLAMRAVSSEPELASLSGVASEKVIFISFVAGSALAGLAGVLASLDVDMTPTMGMRALLMGVVAVIVGGVDSIPGIALGALLLGMAQHFGVWYISSQWQDAIAFIILLIFLLFRPQGFLGKPLRKATV